MAKDNYNELKNQIKSDNEGLSTEEIVDKAQDQVSNLDKEGVVTIEQLQAALPKRARGKIQISQELVDDINDIHKNGGLYPEMIADNVMTHLDLIGRGTSVAKIVDAVKFVTIRNMTGEQERAYRVVFSSKAAEIDARDGDVSSFASEYAGNKIVRDITNRTQIGVSISHGYLANEMINRAVGLARGQGAGAEDYVSPKVQLEAITTVLDKIIPQENKMTIEMGLTENAQESQNALMQTFADVAVNQKKMIDMGMDLKKVQNLGLAEVIDAELEE